MAAEVELAIEDPEFRQSLVEDAAAADEEMAPYYADLFERINKREMARQHRPFAAAPPQRKARTRTASSAPTPKRPSASA